MHVISRKKLNGFGVNHPNVKSELDVWYHMISKNDYPTSNSIIRIFGFADIIPGDRVVFNIKGNSYRIIVKIRYSTQTMFIRFIGTHVEYDKVDAEKI
jgi:mRNA interferase HigB